MTIRQRSTRLITRTRRTACWCALLVGCLALPGCNAVVLVGYLIGGPPSIEPDFDATTGNSMTAKGVTVAVVCYAGNDLQLTTSELDKKLAKQVAFRLHQNDVKVRSPDLVQAWLDENSDWDSPAEIGAALEVDYVIYIDLSDFGLFEPDSAQLYRGRAEGMVSVFQMDEDGHGDSIYSKEIVSKYPLKVARSTQETSYARFKKEYFSRLSEEIGRLFYPWYNGDNIGAAG